ncbi:MAG: terminase [Pseudomonadota bacterium]
MAFDAAPTPHRDGTGRYLPGHDQSGPGRRTKYHEGLIPMAGKLAECGLTDVELADMFGIAPSTLYLWHKRHNAFSEAIGRGKTIADGRVAHALYRLAIGFDYTEEKIIFVNGEPTVITLQKHKPPCVRAIMFGLRNRHPKEWGR